MRILLSGSSGFIGSALKILLSAHHHEVVSLVRHASDLSYNSIYWDPTQGNLKKDDFEGFDAVIHLAGSSIAQLHWSKKVKDALFLSRCRDTWLLSQVLCRLYQPPKTLICASAVGIYGNRGSETLTETSSLGSGFIADLCKKWEASTQAIENRGTRVVHARFGIVLSQKGGILPKLQTVFRFGLGAKLGSGHQYISWISLEDLLDILLYCLTNENLMGPINCTSPNPVTQKEFANTLAKALHRPRLFSVPAFFLKMLFGEMAREVLLSGQKVIPEKLLQLGYTFRYPDLLSAFKQL